MTIQVLSLGHSQHVVQLSDELLNGGDELNDTLRDDNRTEVVAIGCTGAYGVGDVVDDIVEAHTLGLNLLRNEADVRLCL